MGKSMLKLKLLERFLAEICRKGTRFAALALILASTWIPRAEAQQFNIVANPNPACPGATVSVSVTFDYNGEDYGLYLGVTGCTITNTDSETYAYGSFTMPNSTNVVIGATYDLSSDSLTVSNAVNIPASTNSAAGAGTVISNGVLSPTDFILCAVGSGITAHLFRHSCQRDVDNEHKLLMRKHHIVQRNCRALHAIGRRLFYLDKQWRSCHQHPGRIYKCRLVTFEGYVKFIPPARFPLTNAVTVDIGQLTVCVFSFSNTCTSGSVSLASTSASTNYILGDAPSLSAATTNATDALFDFITNCPCDSSLDADVTSNLPATIILSKWWTVRGPGTTYTNHGIGLSTGPLSPLPTNGGTGTATFYVSYTTWTNSANSAPWCCTNTNSVQVPFNVLSLNIVDTNNLPITNANNNNVVIVGQNIALNAQSAGGTFSNYQWTVGATVTPIFLSQGMPHGQMAIRHH